MEENEQGAVKRSWQILPGVLAFLFFTGLTIAYFVVHKPFTPDQALSLGIAFGRLVVVWLLVSVAGGLGQDGLTLTFVNFENHTAIMKGKKD